MVKTCTRAKNQDYKGKLVEKIERKRADGHDRSHYAVSDKVIARTPLLRYVTDVARHIGLVCLFVFSILRWLPYWRIKKLSYRRGTARCVVSIEILPIATQQCRNYLYDKS